MIVVAHHEVVFSLVQVWIAIPVILTAIVTFVTNLKGK